MDEDTGTKRLVSNVFKMMEKDMHVDIDELKDSIKDVVIKVFFRIINII
jgi:ribosomal protein S3AE